MRTRIISIIISALLCGCAAARPPIPTGTIPEPHAVSQADDTYGQEVLRQLAVQYPISNDSTLNARALRVVARLAKAVGSHPMDWNVYVLQDPKIANAAATRGNYVFVWSGMLQSVPDDGELAAVLSHEIGHVLAGHTKATPQEEVSEMATGLAGLAVGQYLGVGGDIAQSIVTELLKGILVNPESQRKEHEADEIGIFILAKAGYDPYSAVAFWQRANKDPRFASSIPEFFSSHPSSQSRLERLRALVPQAEGRYRRGY